jgi:uncharacterized membrane protein YsdA (DUF1294 family)
MQLEPFAAFTLIYLLLNLAVYCVYWWDKQAAIEGGWRVRESTLLMLAFIGGSIGAIMAQRILRHKTRKEPFRTILALIASLHVVVATFVAGIWLLAPEGTIAAMLKLPAGYQEAGP